MMQPLQQRVIWSKMLRVPRLRTLVYTEPRRVSGRRKQGQRKEGKGVKILFLGHVESISYVFYSFSPHDQCLFNFPSELRGHVRVASS